MSDEIYNEEMTEEEVIAAFKEAAQGSPEEETQEEQTQDNTEDLEQPEEVTEGEEVQTADEQPEPAETEEESSQDIIDFSKPLMLKDRDLELPINNRQELEDLARKGLNFTRKTQELAKYRTTVDYLNNHNIDMDTLQTLVEAQNGSKEALGKLAKQANIDVFDVDTDKEFTPNPDFAPRQMSEVDMVAEEIQQQPEVAEKFRGFMDYTPDSFKNQLASDADTLRKFATDVRNGVADKIMPEAVKLHALRGGDFIQSYIEAGNKVFSQETVEQPTQAQPSAPVAEPSPNRAKAGVASSTTSSGGQSFDVWGATDEELLAKIEEMSRR